MFTVEFTGSGREYFRIWLVNLALTVATLGVYSAWAKVRRLQYFYRHTRVAGAGFDFVGDPIVILKGRIVALVLFVLYSTAGYFHPAITVTIFGGLAAALPWLLMRSWRFRLFNTSYRGLRFEFRGAAASAYWVLLGLPVLSVISLLTLVPFWQHRLKRYQHREAAYGQTSFAFAADVGEFYKTYVLAGLLAFGCLMALVFVFFVGGLVAAVVSGGGPGGAPPSWVLAAMGTVAVLVYIAAYFGVRAFTYATIQNAVWNGMTIGRHRFVCRFDPAGLFAIDFTNALATVATLGLYRPFALVRRASYLASSFLIIGPDAFHEFVAGDAQEAGATGEESAELFGLDIAF